ncbi:hypothetical protein [Luteimonas sp. 3794]|uniref:hypothetical protein n=1 Tax=Luteimonas sp. 3794 TaxID=2817730 RepID=UPI00285919B9|nr:hypothetical protein [Luteimonas sp. 3794]MDR6992463.1 hypothetical protein [Luteimonas sp. 3794]
MNSGDLLALYERMDHREQEARNKIDSRLQLELAVLTVLGTANAYILLKAVTDEAAGTAWFAIFLVCYVVNVALFVASCFHYVRALWGHDYECLPTARKIEKYWQELGSFYTTASNVAEQEMDAAVREYFIKCASMNAEVNTLRSQRLHHSISYAVYSLPMCFVSGTISVVASWNTN